MSQCVISYSYLAHPLFFFILESPMVIIIINEGVPIDLILSLEPCKISSFLRPSLLPTPLLTDAVSKISTLFILCILLLANTSDSNAFNGVNIPQPSFTSIGMQKTLMEALKKVLNSTKSLARPARCLNRKKQKKHYPFWPSKYPSLLCQANPYHRIQNVGYRKIHNYVSASR
jgi:hypothetical protein